MRNSRGLGTFPCLSPTTDPRRRVVAFTMLAQLRMAAHFSKLNLPSRRNSLVPFPPWSVSRIEGNPFPSSLFHPGQRFRFRWLLSACSPFSAPGSRQLHGHRCACPFLPSAEHKAWERARTVPAFLASNSCTDLSSFPPTFNTHTSPVFASPSRISVRWQGAWKRKKTACEISS